MARKRLIKLTLLQLYLYVSVLKVIRIDIESQFTAKVANSC